MTDQEAELRAQLAALEEQLAVARMQQSLSKVPATDPEGEYEEEVYEEVDDNAEEEVIVIEEIIDDGEEFEEVIVVEEEVEDDDEEYMSRMEQEYEEIVEEVTVEGDEEDPVQPTETSQPTAVAYPSSRTAPPPMVPLVEPPKEETPPAPPAPVAAEPPKPGPPQPVAARDAGPANKSASSVLAVDKSNSPNVVAGEEPKPRKKWIPMSQRFPEKFKSKDPTAAKALAAASADPRVSGKPVSADDKPQKVKPLPFRAKTYPSVPASPAGKETPMEKLLGPQLLKNVQMQKLSVNSVVQSHELIGLYFGAAWQKPCKAMHQPLIDFYRLTTKDEKMEIVYMSADRTLFEFKDIFQKFDFLAMPTGTTQLKNNLTKKLKVVDMPFLVVLEASTGNVVTVEAAQQIMDLPSRDKAAALRLVQCWKQIQSVPLDKFKPSAKGSASQVKKGNLIWS